MPTDKQLSRNRVTAAEVRAWARAQGHEVGQRGHLPPKVISAYNRTHRTFYLDTNPARDWNKTQEVDA